MNLETTALEFHQQLLKDMHSARDERYAHLGSPPEAIIVEQKEPSPHSSFNIGITMKRWRVTQDSVRQVNHDEPMPEQHKQGMYYDYGKGDFAILAGERILRIGWQVGPRYGRGFDIPFEEKPGGEVSISAPVPTWIS